MAPTELQYKLVEYIDAATDMAESIRADLALNGKVSEKSTLALVKFAKCAEALDKFTRLINDGVRQLQ